jgi:hypothetical protein
MENFKEAHDLSEIECKIYLEFLEKSKLGCWWTPIIPALGRLKQICEFLAKLGYVVRTYLRRKERRERCLTFLSL